MRQLPKGDCLILLLISAYTAQKGGGRLKKILLSMVILFWLLVSCSAKPADAKTLLWGVLKENPSLPTSVVIYQSDALPGQQTYMPDRLRSLLYDGGRGREIPEFSAVVDYAVCLSEGICGMEIHIFRMQSRGDARNMQKLLARRAELIKRRSLYLYAPEAYENYLCSAAVYAEGKYVFLLSTGDNTRVLEYLKQHID